MAVSNATLTREQQHDDLADGRKRRQHAKVKTGCITCKIRRKKCDETKPACLRCTKTGRKCDGYVGHGFDIASSSETTITPVHSGDEYLERTATAVLQPSARPNPRWLSQPRGQDSMVAFPGMFQSHICRPPNTFVTTLTDVENQAFSFFCHRTGLQLTSYFSSTFYQFYCTKLAFLHPVVFAAAAAVGAAHRRSTLGISREAFEWCEHSEILIKNARRLLRDFRQAQGQQKALAWAAPTQNAANISSQGVEDSDILMTSHVLHGLFETIQDNPPAGVSALNSGITTLLERPMTLFYTRETSANMFVGPEVLPALFGRIRCRAREVFRSEDRILKLRFDTEYGILPAIPTKFTNAEEARDFLFTEVQWILDMPDELRKADTTGMHRAHVERVLRWSAAYAEMIGGMNSTKRHPRVISLMQLTRSFTYILLYLVLPTNGDRHPGYAGISGYRTMLQHPDALPLMERSVSGLRRWGDRQHIDNYLHNGRSTGADDLLQRESMVDSDLGAPAYASPDLWQPGAFRDDFLMNFHRLQLWSDITLDQTHPMSHAEYTMSWDTGVTSLADPILSPKSSQKIRVRVKNAAKGADENYWNEANNYWPHGLAEQVSASEERAVRDAFAASFPHVKDPRWIDATIFIEEKKLLLQYCVSNLDGQPAKWIQEWWKF